MGFYGLFLPDFSGIEGKKIDGWQINCYIRYELGTFYLPNELFSVKLVAIQEQAVVLLSAIVTSCVQI